MYYIRQKRFYLDEIYDDEKTKISVVSDRPCQNA